MNSRRLTLLATSAFIAMLNLASTFSQPDGFVNINCGSTNDTNYNGFKWISDSSFIKNRSPATVSISSIPIVPPMQYHTIALFKNLEVNKYCYLLPVKPGEIYLVRVVFSWEGFQSQNLASVFNLFVEGIVWKKVNTSQINSKSLRLSREIILAPRSDNLSLCLARNSETEAGRFLYISSIQLVELGDSMYGPTDFNINALDRISLRDYGSAPNANVITDKFGRIWVPFSSDSQWINLVTTQGLMRDDIPNKPPEEVLQTAAVTTELGEILCTNVQLFDQPLSPTLYYFAFYFCNLDETRLSSNRSFYAIINNYTASNWKHFPSFRHCCSLSEILSLDPADRLKITFSAEVGSEMSPFINAHEIHRVLDIRNMTHPPDVFAIHQIAAEINVPDDWTGDPCLPADYSSTGIVCSEDNPPRVIIINLTNMGLKGSIPPSISELTALTELMLDNNILSGSIPDLSSLKNLTKLYLQNNKLVGTIPEGLIKRTSDGSLDLRYEGNEGVGAEKKPLKKKHWIIAPSVGCSLFVIVVISITFHWKYKHKSQIETTDKHRSQIETTDMHRSQIEATDECPILGQPQPSYREAQGQNEYHGLATGYTEEEIKVATEDYKTEIGRGSFGHVYRGKLLGNDVAVKILSTDSHQGPREFETEVTLLSRTYHKNLVKLIGYCREPKVALVYEFMHHGTLKDHLYGTAKSEKRLDWCTRLKIASQAAQGLLYLHEGCNPPIIHRDIKPSNILLDQNMCAKLGDFGLSTLLDKTQGSTSTGVKGTTGYLDPELLPEKDRLLTEKGDVYSFGVVILQIISGKRHNERIVETAREVIRRRGLEDFMDPSLSDKYTLQSAFKVVEIACKCVEPQSKNRPNMNTVAKELEEAMALKS